MADSSVGSSSESRSSADAQKASRTMDLPGEVPEASASTPASDVQENQNNKGKSSVSSSSSSGNTDSPHHSGGPSSTASSSNVGSSSTVSPLAGSGLGTNPFARSVAQPTWGTESSDHKPILAPPKLAPPPPDTGTSKSVLQPSSLGSRLGGGLIGGASSMFTPPILTVTGVFPPQPMKPTFKLKPSVLGAPGANPFAASLPAEPDSKEDSSPAKELDKDPKSKMCSEVSSISSTTSSFISSSSTTISSTVATTRPSAGLGSTASSTSPSLLASTASSSSATSSSKTTPPTKEPAGATALEKKEDDAGVDSSKNLFMPLSNSESKSEDSYKVNGVSSSTSSSFGSPGLQTSGNFIFGQNLHSRVVGADSAVTSSSEAATNGEKATGNLFSDAASELAKPSEDNPWGGKSLEELQQELAERESNQKRKFDEVEVITGEESESNVLQMNCKLYAWVLGTWQERGRGILRLNDWGEAEELHSRLVVRTQGTLTVMLNTKIWAEMSVERASTKSVRFTALDTEGQLKVFLVMGSPKDIDRLYNSLEWRVATSRTQTQDEVVASEVKKLKPEHYMSAANPSS
ncbi:ran-binding protein 3 isoform X2 [Oratosquilla oratoria]|uniref:ran-binding protein 3 isoform X2 n=1 Tax=Oratosquilla oratoria TaxID=337810 RepID=UPI003F75A900